MRKAKPNRARERRIEQAIVVDAYTSDERAIGWHCYFDDKLRFPFKAKCIAARGISPLNKDEEIEVLKIPAQKTSAIAACLKKISRHSSRRTAA